LYNDELHDLSRSEHEEVGIETDGKYVEDDDNFEVLSEDSTFKGLFSDTIEGKITFSDTIEEEEEEEEDNDEGDNNEGIATEVVTTGIFFLIFSALSSLATILLPALS
jgi:hypothetical protein